MCSRAAIGCVIGGLAAVWGSPLAAQDSLAVHERRVQQLAERWRILERQRRETDSLRTARFSLDSFTVGPFDVVTEDGWRARVDPALSHAVRLLADSAEPVIDLLRGVRLLVRPADSWRRPARAWAEVSPGPGALSAWVPLREESFDDAVRRGMTSILPSLLTRRGGSEFVRWLEGQGLPGAGAAPLDDALRQANVELATAPARVIRDCYDGVIPACVRALGLAPVREPWLEYFDEDDRRRLVDARFGWRRQFRDEHRRCVRLAVDSVCVALLRMPGAGYPDPRPPFSAPVRIGLARFAIESGEPGALTRLLGDSAAPVPARVAQAAGLPLDSLTARWRLAALARRPPAVAGTARLRWTSLFWALALTLLALRSTRWRFD